MKFDSAREFLPRIFPAAFVAERRRFLAGIASVAAAALVGSPAHAAEDDKVDFQPERPLGSLRQAVIQLASTGELKLNADGQKVTKRPVQVAAQMAYDETLTDKRAVVRHYTQAQAELLVGKTRFTPQLDDAHHTLALHRDGEQAILYSPLGPLTRDELELAQVPGTAAPAEELLSLEPVGVNQTWAIPDAVLARLLWLDAVSSCDVQATLKSVSDDVALVTLQGPISGAVGGVATEIDLQAKLNYDLRQQLVTWLALQIQENRSIGHAAPGFETKSQIKLAFRPLESSPHLSTEYLATLPLEYQPGSALLQYESSEGRFRALLDRRWRLMVDRHDLTVLRLVDRGDLVAQCNLSRLPALAPGKQLPLEELQDDIKNSLGKNFRQFVEASQSVTDEGLRILRATVVGESSEISVQWNYYHVSNDKGQRLAIVFTFESSLLDRFADLDRSLVASLQFLDDPEPTPVKQDSATAAPQPADAGPPKAVPKTTKKPAAAPSAAKR
ncbi:MAG: hypothetical protein U0939_00395 [Pirellulales bacterium]